MPEYLHPGVYIEEIERGPRPIEGVPTSTAAFLGETERGPIKPRMVTSYKDYQRWFGDVYRPATNSCPMRSTDSSKMAVSESIICRIVGQDCDAARRSHFGANFMLRAAVPGKLGQAHFRQDHR